MVDDEPLCELRSPCEDEPLCELDPDMPPDEPEEPGEPLMPPRVPELPRPSSLWLPRSVRLLWLLSLWPLRLEDPASYPLSLLELELSECELPDFELPDCELPNESRFDC